MSSNDTFFSDVWFSGVKISEEAITGGSYYCGPVKTSYIEKVNRRLISCY